MPHKATMRGRDTGYPGDVLARRDEPFDQHDVTMTGHPGGHISLRA